jgi:hypothetical protein
VCTFSNRLFPTKAIRGWLVADDAAHMEIVCGYFAETNAYEPAIARQCNPLDGGGDPLYAVWARVR